MIVFWLLLSSLGFCFWVLAFMVGGVVHTSNAIDTNGSFEVWIRFCDKVEGDKKWTCYGIR